MNGADSEIGNLYIYITDLGLGILYMNFDGSNVGYLYT